MHRGRPRAGDDSEPELVGLFDALESAGVPFDRTHLPELRASLRDIYVVSPMPPLPRPSVAPGRCAPAPATPMLNVVLLAIRSLLASRQENVLAYGYRRTGSWSNGGGLQQATDLTCNAENPAVHILSRPRFAKLQELLGDEAMLYVLCKCTLLCMQERDCFLQLTGPPLTTAPLAAQPRLPVHATSTAAEGEGGSEVGLGDSLHDGQPRTQAGAVGQKRRNPGAAERPFVSKRSKTTAPCPGTSSPGQPAGAGLGPTRGAPPQRRVDPLNCVLPRWGLMYASPPPRGRTCLPLQHVLNVLVSGRAGRRSQARRLVAHIFGLAGSPGPGLPPGGFCPSELLPNGQPHRPVERDLSTARGLGAGRQGRRLPRLPARLRVLEAAFARLLHRHSRARYAEVIAHCCPQRKEAQRLLHPAEGEAAPPDEVARGVANLPWHLRDDDDVQSQASPGSPVHAVAPAAEDGAALRAIPSVEELQAELFKLETPRREVGHCAVAIAQYLVPRRLLGSAHNWRLFLAQARRVALLPRKAYPTGRVLIHRMRLQHVTWLWAPGNVPRTHRSAQRRAAGDLARLVLFLLGEVVVPLLRAAFHVAEGVGSEAPPGELRFFLHPVWSQLQTRALRQLNRMGLQRLRPDELADRLRPRAPAGGQHRPLGVSRLRFRPKATGLRPICMLSGSARLRGGPALPPNSDAVNKVLREPFAVLRAEARRRPELMGTSVLGVSGVRDRLVRLAHAWRGYLSAEGALASRRTAPELHFASVDVAACFDTIAQDQLARVLDDVLATDTYVLRTFSTVPLAPTTPARAPGRARTGAKRPRRAAFQLDAVPMAEYSVVPREQDLPRLLGGEAPSGVVVDHGRSRVIPRSQARELIDAHIHANLVAAPDGHVYLQTVGVPQGSTLAAILCSLHYGHLDRRHFAHLLPDGEGRADGPPRALVRLIDDFLFASADAAECAAFLDTMRRGLPDYGCAVNWAKCGASAPVGRSWARAAGRPALRVLEVREAVRGLCFFPWCGLLICTSTAEVLKDYRGARASAGAVEGPVSAQVFEARTLRCATTKVQAVAFDARINGLPTTLYNAYQAAYFTAIRFVTLGAHLTHQSPSFLALTARRTARAGAARALALWQLSLAAPGPARPRPAPGPPGGLGLQLQWLWLTAFVRVLSRKRPAPAFRAVLMGLRRDLLGDKFTALVCDAEVAQRLRDASDDSRETMAPLLAA